MGADFIYVMCERAVPYETALERIEAMSPEEIAEKWDMVFDPEIDFHGEAKECLDYVYNPPRDADTVLRQRTSSLLLQVGYLTEMILQPLLIPSLKFIHWE